MTETTEGITPLADIDYRAMWLEQELRRKTAHRSRTEMLSELAGIRSAVKRDRDRQRVEREHLAARLRRVEGLAVRVEELVTGLATAAGIDPGSRATQPERPALTLIEGARE